MPSNGPMPLERTLLFSLTLIQICSLIMQDKLPKIRGGPIARTLEGQNRTKKPLDEAEVPHIKMIRRTISISRAVPVHRTLESDRMWLLVIIIIPFKCFVPNRTSNVVMALTNTPITITGV